jgi:hypothetical protein
MARREQESDALTPEQLAELRYRLTLLSPYDVERFYRTAYERCVLQPNRVPSAIRMQELVTAWKQLRKWCAKRR